MKLLCFELQLEHEINNDVKKRIFFSVVLFYQISYNKEFIKMGPGYITLQTITSMLLLNPMF